jgi:glycosyltransferase involved in cell wall biosynthesis
MSDKNKFLKIALMPTGGKSWTGGLTYRENLLTALTKYVKDTKIYVFTDGEKDFKEDFENCKYFPFRKKNGALSNIINRAFIKFFSYDIQLAKNLNEIKEGKPDVIFPSKYRAGKKIGIIYWIPDFQFLHLPEMYSESEISALKRNFRKGIENCTLLLLSSQSAERDFKEFMPEFANKARVVSFVAHIPADFYNEDPKKIVKRYNIPEKFIYLPNQFWKHKNHIVVFEALKILKDKGIYPFVVMTGNPVDSRNPLFFADLTRKISELGIRDQIAILGLVPHNDVYMLIRQAAFVLNPSLFEGWSTTVEECKSVGKKMVLSDLTVHREQNHYAAKYFNPKSPEELAELIKEEWENSDAGPDLELEKRAIKELPERMSKFAEKFTEVCKEASRKEQN